MKESSLKQLKIDFKEQGDFVYATTILNGYKYKLTFEDYYNHWNVTLGSGKKRKLTDIFQQKQQKSHNGYEVVKWCLAVIDQFPYKGRIVVYWWDGRRRRIYGRFLLQKRFKLTRFEGNLCYMKEYV